MIWDVNCGSRIRIFFHPGSRIQLQGRNATTFVFIKGESGSLCAQDNLGIEWGISRDFSKGQ